MGKAIVLATPVFFLLIGIEYLVGRLRGQQVYRLNDTLNSLSLGVMSQVSGLFLRVLGIGIYAAVYSVASLQQLPIDAWWVWVLAVVAYDFCYYWNHRLGHTSAILWAAHVVHHQSQEYNLSTALRQTSSGALLGWVFYLPMALAGFPPQVFAAAALIDLLYQYWIHTEQVGKLGWFDRVFASPSNHRVHHAINDRYLDHNYGGILVIWDRLFGTFVEEDEPCHYGTRSPLRSWDPVRANLQVYLELWQKSRRARNVREAVAYWLKPPGWQPVSADARPWTQPPLEAACLQRFDPALAPGSAPLALGSFVLALAGSALLLWNAAALPMPWLAGGALTLILSLWGTGALLQSRLSLASGAGLQLACLGAAAVLMLSLPAWQATA
ncbi:MAG: sterol desaturase family protein [Steroidobacteraceae bacterium]